MLQKEILEDVERFKHLLASLQAGPPPSTRTLNTWAEAVAREPQIDTWSF